MNAQPFLVLYWVFLNRCFANFTWVNDQSTSSRLRSQHCAEKKCNVYTSLHHTELQVAEPSLKVVNYVFQFNNVQ